MLSARAGTPIAEIERLVAESGQELAFEPADYGPLLGAAAGAGSIGGVLVTNFSGPRRRRPAPRAIISSALRRCRGGGRPSKSGGRRKRHRLRPSGADGRVLRTLGAMTDVTIKTLPRAETEATLLVAGLDGAKAARAMAQAMGSSFDSPARRICRRKLRVRLQVWMAGNPRPSSGSKGCHRRCRIVRPRSQHSSRHSARRRRCLLNFPGYLAGDPRRGALCRRRRGDGLAHFHCADAGRGFGRRDR